MPEDLVPWWEDYMQVTSSFADWLEEQGHEELAEVWRTRIRAAQAAAAVSGRAGGCGCGSREAGSAG